MERHVRIGVFMAKLCKLPGCNVSFVPKRAWQKCCSVEHGRKLRYLRRKEKLRPTVTVEVTAPPIKVDNPRMSIKVEGIK